MESINDMVFDLNGYPAWCNSPDSCRTWLKQQLKLYPGMWEYTVRLGATLKTVTVHDYLKDGKR